MKNIIRLAVTLGLGAFSTLAQQHPGGPGGRPGGRPGGGPPPVPPLMAVLDADQNGELSAAELANATTALKTLDKNGDAKLTAEELMPPPPGGTNQFRLAAPPGAKHPVPPILAALDTNGDGELDATEIANASAALQQLDTNGDGTLTRDELCPHPPGGPGGPGGPEGSGGPGGPNEPPEQ
jgi:hypothetical protein